MKYTYRIETYMGDDFSKPWVKIKEGTLSYLRGWLDGRKDYFPRSHFQLVRSDGKVIETLEARYEVGIGMIAGWPTAQQYERAGNEALERARQIRLLNDLYNTEDSSR